MPIRTKRWDEETEPADGLRILVCRYRPRGLRKELETWSLWLPELGPSVELHAAAYGKRGVKIGWEIYRRRYLAEMRAPEAQAAIQELAARLRAGQTLTLLCSSSCLRESRCHRSLLADVITTAASASAGMTSSSPSSPNPPSTPPTRANTPARTREIRSPIT